MKCLYHLSDMDGWCSAAIVALKTNNYNKEDYIGIDYNKHKIEDMDFSNIFGEVIYISDLSFTEKNMNVLLNLAKNNHVIWCDHHASSVELIKKYPQLEKIDGKRSIDYSGCMLTYIHLNNCSADNVNRVVKLVSDWDTFQHKFGDITRYFKNAIDSDSWFTYPLSLQWKLLLSDNTENELNKLISKGKIIDEYINTEYARYRTSNAYESEYNGIRCAVLNRAANSLIFGDLYERYPFVSTFVYDGQKFKYSIYSNKEDIECNKIAEKFGGGGHKGAAGFMTDKIIFPFIREIDFSDTDNEIKGDN